MDKKKPTRGPSGWINDQRRNKIKHLTQCDPNWLIRHANWFVQCAIARANHFRRLAVCRHRCAKRKKKKKEESKCEQSLTVLHGGKAAKLGASEYHTTIHTTTYCRRFSNHYCVAAFNGHYLRFVLKPILYRRCTSWRRLVIVVFAVHLLTIDGLTVLYRMRGGRHNTPHTPNPGKRWHGGMRFRGADPRNGTLKSSQCGALELRTESAAVTHTHIHIHTKLTSRMNGGIKVVCNEFTWVALVLREHSLRSGEITK